MNGLTEITDSLYIKIDKLIKDFNQLKQSHQLLRADLALEQKKHAQTQDELVQWKSQAESLKITNAILGSEQFKRETKLKINSLVREIDDCISQLSGQ